MKSVILIQNAASSMGGVETLIARIAGKLTKNGVEVSVIILGNSAQSRVINLIPDGCRLIFFPSTLYSDIFYPKGIWHRQWRDVLPDSCDVILSFSPAGIAAMRFLRKAWFKAARELVYVVHPKMLVSGFSEVPSYINTIIRSLPAEAFIFMNKACQYSNCSSFNAYRVDASSVVPLPVDPFDPCEIRSTRPRRLVSIGRIESGMKTYNWLFINDFCALAYKYGLIWEIYGSGTREDLESLSNAIEKCSARDRIRICGEIPQQDIPKVLTGAFAFIGMGTALVQAASCGIPSIVAIGYHREPAGYGWFFNVPFPCVGEDLGQGYEKIRIASTVEELALMEENRVADIGRRCRERALLFSSDKFMDKVEGFDKEGAPISEVSLKIIIKFWFRYTVWRIFSKIQRRNRLSSKI